MGDNSTRKHELTGKCWRDPMILKVRRDGVFEVVRDDGVREIHYPNDVYYGR